MMEANSNMKAKWWVIVSKKNGTTTSFYSGHEDKADAQKLADLRNKEEADNKGTRKYAVVARP